MSTARDAVRAEYERLESYVTDDSPRKVCSWCRMTISQGSEPASHGSCPRCARRLMADHAITELRKLNTLHRRGEPTEDQFIATVNAIYAVIDAGEETS